MLQQLLLNHKSVQLGNVTTIPLVHNVQSTDVFCARNSPCQVHKMKLSSSDGGRARLPSRDMNSENTMRAWWSLIHWCLERQSTHGGDTNSENTEVWFTGVWKHCGDMNSENTDAWLISVWKDNTYKHTWLWHEQWKYRSPIHWCLETLWWYEQSQYRSLIHWCLERQQLNLWIPCCDTNSEYTEWFYRSLYFIGMVKKKVIAVHEEWKNSDCEGAYFTTVWKNSHIYVVMKCMVKTQCNCGQVKLTYIYKALKWPMKTNCLK